MNILIKIKFCLPSASIYLENASTAIAIYRLPFLVNGSGPSIKTSNLHIPLFDQF